MRTAAAVFPRPAGLASGFTGCASPIEFAAFQVGPKWRARTRRDALEYLNRELAAMGQVLTRKPSTPYTACSRWMFSGSLSASIAARNRSVSSSESDCATRTACEGIRPKRWNERMPDLSVSERNRSGASWAPSATSTRPSSSALRACWYPPASTLDANPS